MLLFYFEVKWFSNPVKNWGNIKLVVLLNHTSLFEPLFIRLAPIHFIWLLSENLVAPGADITLDRPVVGKIYKLLLPGCIPITRKKDHSWQYFLTQVHDNAITAILPEGRMKRLSGKDKHGNAMDVRGGIADILEKLTEGDALFIYSGGLHHIHAPGDKFPRFLKKIKVNLELLDIKDYKNKFTNSDLSFKKQVIADLNLRLKSHSPD